MATPALTAEQEAEAKLAQILFDKTKGEVLYIARLLISKPDRDLPGET